MIVCSSLATSASVMGSARLRRRRGGAGNYRAPAAFSPATAIMAGPTPRPTDADAMFTRTFGYILAAALAAGLGLLVARHLLDRDAAPAGPALQTVTLLPQPRELPPFKIGRASCRARAAR